MLGSHHICGIHIKRNVFYLDKYFRFSHALKGSSYNFKAAQASKINNINNPMATGTIVAGVGFFVATQAV